MDSLLINYEEKISKVGQKISMALQPYENDDGIKGHAEHIREIYQDKLKDVRPKLMVYGIYNAGKSSIINELLGADKAEVEDVPKTDKVTGYEWNGYTLYDTPGVGAPIEHENVTNEHLKDADIVMFVMSTTGSSEKAENYIRMKDIADAGKKIIIVLNDKNGDLGVHDDIIQEIKIHVSEHMKQVGIAEVEKKYCIVVVNAMRAKKGREKNSPALWEKSNMEELRQVLLSELKKTSSFQVMRRLVGQMQQELLAVLGSLQEKGQQGGLESLNEILQELQKQRIDLRKSMQAYIERKCEMYGRQLADQIWQNRENENACKQVVQEMNQNLVSNVQRKLKDEIAEMTESLRNKIESIVAANEIQQGDLSGNTLNGEMLKPGQKRMAMEQMMPASSDISMKNVMGNMLELLSTDQLVQTGIQSLTKNILKTQIGHMVAKTFLGRAISSFIPYIGPIITGLTIIYSLVERSYRKEEERRARDLAENEAARKRAEAEAQAWQDLQQKCQYAAEELGENLVISVNEILRNIFHQIEDPIRQEMQNNKALEAEKVKWGMELQELVINCEDLRVSLGENETINQGI